MQPIVGKAVKRIPYIGPLVSGVGLALDVKKVVEDATPMGAAKIIAGRFVKECTPPNYLLPVSVLWLLGALLQVFQPVEIH